MINGKRNEQEKIKDEWIEYVATKTPYKKEEVEMYVIHIMALVHEDRVKDFIDKELIYILFMFPSGNIRFITEYIRIRSLDYKLSDKRQEEVKEIQVERIYLEVYGDTIKDEEYQKIKKAEIEQILQTAERIK